MRKHDELTTVNVETPDGVTFTAMVDRNGDIFDVSEDYLMVEEYVTNIADCLMLGFIVTHGEEYEC